MERSCEFPVPLSSHQDKHNQALNMCLAGVQWMGVRVEFLAALLIGAVAFSVVGFLEDPGKHSSLLPRDV